MDILVSLLLVLVVARFLGELAERVRVPALVGEIFAGILLGPSLLGMLSPDVGIRIVADLGIFFIVYLAALELTFKDVKRSIREAGVFIAIGSFTIPVAVGLAIGTGFGLPLTTAAFLGIALGFTAMPVLVRILSDLDLLNTHIGRSLVAAALLCDIAGLAGIGVLLNIGGASNADVLGAVIVILKFAVFAMTMLVVDALFRYRHGALGSWLLRRTQHLLTKGATFALPFLVALGFAFFADVLGLHFIVGAFFGTLLVAEHVIGESQTEEVRKATHAVTLGLLAPVFFAFIGLTFVVSSLANLPLVVAILAGAIGGKVAGGYLGARWSKLSGRHSLAVGIGMNGRGAMELVVAALGLELGFIDASLFSVLVFVGVATTVMTPILLRIVLRRETEAAEAKRPTTVGGANGGT